MKGEKMGNGRKKYRRNTRNKSKTKVLKLNQRFFKKHSKFCWIFVF